MQIFYIFCSGLMSFISPICIGKILKLSKIYFLLKEDENLEKNLSNRCKKYKKLALPTQKF
jgi:hypothetical protein